MITPHESGRKLKEISRMRERDMRQGGAIKNNIVQTPYQRGLGDRCDKILELLWHNNDERL